MSNPLHNIGSAVDEDVYYDQGYLNEAVDQFHLVSKDERESAPFSLIGFLQIMAKEGVFSGVGTGILISSNLVLTCAHNVINPQTAKMFNEIRFFPGHSG
jgi:V8-like Glu-specific endopeptidase